MKHSTARSPKLIIPFWKKIVFSSIITICLLLFIEVILIIIGVKPFLQSQDPFTGFSSDIPLFIESKKSAGTTQLVTADNKLRFFNMQSFTRKKRHNTFRIFCVGGSTTYGRPYNDPTSFCGWLRAFLNEADPKRNWEVINAGGISYGSYRISLLMKELIQYDPDLFIIYTGHNEFLERITYSKNFTTPKAIRKISASIYRTRIATVMKNGIDLISDGQRKETDNNKLESGEISAILDNTIGPEDYYRDDALRSKVLENFRSNLTDMADIAESIKAKVILIAPASNLRDSYPFKSQHKEGLSKEELRAWNTLFNQANQFYSIGQYDTSMVLLNKASDIDDNYAHLHYLLGKAWYALGNYNEALNAFVRARDEDICPLRSLSPTEEIVAHTAGQKNIFLVDFNKYLMEISENSIPGFDLFLDHVHPTIETNRRLGLLILNALISEGVVQPALSWNPKAIDRISHEVNSQIDKKTHSVALRNLSKVLGWAGKFEEAGYLAERALEMDSDDAEAHLNAGAALARDGRFEEAMTHYEKVLKIWPNYAKAHYNIGHLLTQKKQFEKAIINYKKAIALKPDFAIAHNNIGTVLEIIGEFEEAALYYKHAIAINPDYAFAHNNFGNVLQKTGNFKEAITHHQCAVKIRPDYVRAFTDLGRAFEHQGKYKLATNQYKHSLILNPNFWPAHLSLGILKEKQNQTAEAVGHYRAVLQINTSDLMAQNRLAWILATDADKNLRNGTEALNIAIQTAERTKYNELIILNTLGAAYAETGQFEKAVEIVKIGITLAKKTKEIDLMDLFNQQLNLYKNNIPYRMPQNKK